MINTAAMMIQFTRMTILNERFPQNKKAKLKSFADVELHISNSHFVTLF